MIDVPQTFPGKKEGDKVVMFIRRHYIRYIFLIVFSVILLLIPFTVILTIIFNSYAVEGIFVEALTVAITAYLMALMSLCLYFFVDYYLDMLVLTEDRIVYIRQNGFFFQQIDEVYYKQVEEMGVDVKGPLRSVFNYGTLVIHPGNEQAVLTIDNVPDPIKVSRFIMDKHKEADPEVRD